eukprot:1160418-Pelagomonas_calceolata.AAC.7
MSPWMRACMNGTILVQWMREVQGSASVLHLLEAIYWIGSRNSEVLELRFPLCSTHNIACSSLQCGQQGLAAPAVLGREACTFKNGLISLDLQEATKSSGSRKQKRLQLQKRMMKFHLLRED